MSTLASTLIDQVESDLFDESNTRWAASGHLASLNAAERQLVFFLPTAYTVTAVYQLVAGVRQSLPDGTANYLSPTGSTHPQAVELVSINRNMGADGLTAGNAIVPAEKKDFDELVPDWPTDTASATVLHSMFDPKDRKKWFCYPAQPALSMGWVEAVYSASPVPLTVVGDSLNVDDIYAEPIKHYMLYAAYTMDAKTSEFAAARAIAHWNAFVTAIGRKDLVQSRYRGNNDSNYQPVS